MEKTNDCSYENGSKTGIMAAILGTPGDSSLSRIPNTPFPGTPCPGLPYTQLETGTVLPHWAPQGLLRTPHSQHPLS